MELPKVFVGAPVRDRGWVLQRHLDAINIQTGVDMQLHYILNDSEDNTEDILKANKVPFSRYNLGRESGSVRGEYSTLNLARLRNFMISQFLDSNCDYLLSVDTDIIIPPGSIEKLIANDKDIISMLIRNHPTLMAHNALNVDGHLESIPSNSVIEVDITGAVYLIKREVLMHGVDFGYNYSGEDISFSENARRRGYKLYCNTGIKPIHAYAPGVDLVAKTN